MRINFFCKEDDFLCKVNSYLVKINEEALLIQADLSRISILEKDSSSFDKSSDSTILFWCER